MTVVAEHAVGVRVRHDRSGVPWFHAYCSCGWTGASWNGDAGGLENADRERRQHASHPLVPLPFERDDGGRAAAGFRGQTGDCVTRAIAIATGLPYRQVYDGLAAGMAARGKARSARDGIDKPGCTVHLAEGELPHGRLVVALSRHLVAVVDGVVRDTHDPTREGTRCVYGYWRPS